MAVLHNSNTYWRVIGKSYQSKPDGSKGMFIVLHIKLTDISILYHGCQMKQAIAILQILYDFCLQGSTYLYHYIKLIHGNKIVSMKMYLAQG